MADKYIFTGKQRNGLRQILRLSDRIIGGWLETEDNLSHSGSCWVADSTQVFGNARIISDAQVGGFARVMGSAIISNTAHIMDYARVSGNAVISNNVIIMGNTHVRNDVFVGGSVVVKSNGILHQNARAEGNAEICGTVRGNAYVAGDVIICDHSVIDGDAVVMDNEDYECFVDGEFLCTWTRSDDMILIGCERRTVDKWWRVMQTNVSQKVGIIITWIRIRFADQRPDDFMPYSLEESDV